MAVTKFEDLKVWQKARSLNKAVHILTRSAPMSRDYAFVDQLRRSALSVMNNIAEGFDRYRRAEFLQYLSTAKASAGEVRSMLYSGLDVGYISQARFDELMLQVNDLATTISAFRTALERSPPKPLKR